MDEDYIEIKSLTLATYLYSTNKVNLKGKRKSINGEVYFQFTPKKLVEELINLYWNDTAPTIQPKQLFNAQRDLKDMIYGD